MSSGGGRRARENMRRGAAPQGVLLGGEGCVPSRQGLARQLGETGRKFLFPSFTKRPPVSHKILLFLQPLMAKPLPTSASLPLSEALQLIMVIRREAVK